MANSICCLCQKHAHTRADKLNVDGSTKNYDVVILSECDCNELGHFCDKRDFCRHHLSACPKKPPLNVQKKPKTAGKLILRGAKKVTILSIYRNC